jgi:hypothetical protein
MIQLKKIDPKVVLLLVSLIITASVMLMLGPARKLDGRPYYSPEDAGFYLNSLTLIERGFYLYGEIVDLWFLTNYSWLLFLGYRYFYPQKLVLQYLVLLPGLLDIIETVSIMGFLIQGQTLINLTALSIVSCIKWSTVVSAVGFLLVKFILPKK